jgi:hypothetical protein
MFDMTAGHFIFIPAILVFGIVLGWILGSRTAADAYASELKRREERGPRMEPTRSTSDVRQPATGGKSQL